MVSKLCSCICLMPVHFDFSDKSCFLFRFSVFFVVVVLLLFNFDIPIINDMRILFLLLSVSPLSSVFQRFFGVCLLYFVLFFSDSILFLVKPSCYCCWHLHSFDPLFLLLYSFSAKVPCTQCVYDICACVCVWKAHRSLKIRCEQRWNRKIGFFAI